MDNLKCQHGVYYKFRCNICDEEIKKRQLASANAELESKKREAVLKKSLFAASVEEHMLVMIGVAVIAFVVLIAYAFANRSIKDDVPTQPSNSSNATVGTMRAVKPIQLNMRSGPGKQYSVVRVFKQDERIVSIGEPQNVNGELWIQAVTPDGQTRGWVNRQMLYP